MVKIFTNQLKILNKFKIFLNKGFGLNSIGYISFVGNTLGADYIKFRLKEKK